MGEQLAGAASVTFAGFLAGGPLTQGFLACIWLTQVGSLSGSSAGLLADVPLQNHSCVVDKSASSLGRAAPPCRPHRGQQQHTVLGLLPSPSLLAAAAVQSLTARRQLCSFADWRLQQSAITKRHSSLPCHYFSYRPHALPVLPQFLLSGRCNTKAQVSRREVSHRWCTAWCSRSLCCSLQPC